jgi:YegS/Rv2252/BmrU family lipid kinase
MNAVVLINAHSRRARKLLSRVQADFESDSLPFNVLEFIVVKKKRDFPKVYEHLKNMKRVNLVIIGSGDGTITTTINHLRGKKITYGLLPLGTSNTFMYNLGLSLDYEEAMKVIRTGVPTYATLGEMNGQLFTCNAAIGVSTNVAQNISDKTKRYLGQFGYLVSGVKELIRHSPFECRVIIDNQVQTFHTHQLLVANGHYHGHTPIGKAASVYKNQLVLVAFGADKSRRQHIASMVRFALNRHTQDPETLVIPFRHASLTTTPLRNIEADGEVVAATPVTFQALPEAIRVLV